MNKSKSFFTGNRVFTILCILYGCVLQFGESSMTRIEYNVFLTCGAIFLIYIIFLLDKENMYLVISESPRFQESRLPASLTELISCGMIQRIPVSTGLDHPSPSIRILLLEYFSSTMNQRVTLCSGGHRILFQKFKYIPTVYNT
jgi:hypothetical protein